MEFEQQGKESAEYGEKIIASLAKDLTARFGRGFSKTNIFHMRLFYLVYKEKFQTVSGILKDFDYKNMMKILPLSWSQYVKLLSVRDKDARNFYENEAIRGGWSVRQLDRQISTQFYERTLISKNKVSMLEKGRRLNNRKKTTPEEEIKERALAILDTGVILNEELTAVIEKLRTQDLVKNWEKCIKDIDEHRNKPPG